MKKTLASALAFCVSLICFAQNPPITPAWAFGHIVWEDNINTREGAEKLVNGYLDRDIPVDGIIIDSPWAVSYNDFNWDTERYPDPTGLAAEFKAKNVKLILWMTGLVNEQCADAREQKCSDYDEMKALGYGVDNSTPLKWWKGYGMHLDFTNPSAVDWWYKRVDKAFTDNVYGLKVDQGEDYVGLTVETSKGRIAKKEFAKYYYDSMYDYAVSRKSEGVAIARPYSHQGGFAASPAKLNLGWCGDFSGDWDGLKLQIEDIYISSEAGYAAIATEIGGFAGAQANGEQLVRYAQFASMTACMINGGMNGAFTSHIPWYHGEEETKAYAFCVNLHRQLKPYLFSTVVDGHIHGNTLVRDCSFEEESHQVGENIFTKAITTDGGHARFHLPSESRWIDYWTGEIHEPGTMIEKTYSLDQFPLYFKSGSITPLDGKDSITLMIYPDGKTTQLLHLPCGDGIDYTDCLVSYDEKSGLLTIKSDVEKNYTVIVKGASKTRQASVSGKEISTKIK